MISIIVPAHNEANSISDCLSSLLSASRSLDLQIIVVCNGCTDATPEIVKLLSPFILCVETNIPSKSHALNLGDERALYFPRIYLDADVILSIDAIQGIQNKLQQGYLAVAPEVKMDFSGCSWIVRAYYDIWLRLSYCQSGMIGSGVYALSKIGRQRFDCFPDIIADDGYVRCLFTEQERSVVKGVYSVVKAPKNFWNLIKIKTRSRLGRYELEQIFPDLLRNEHKDYFKAFKDYLYKPYFWPKLAVYFLVNVISRIRATKQLKRQFKQWERDDSNR